eukprot:498133_1
MLSKTLIVVATLTCKILGSNYYVSSNPGQDYTCTGNSTCNIYCDSSYSTIGATFNCGNAGECYFYCEEKKCAQTITLNATNSNNLYVVLNSNSDECMKSTIIYTPEYGNAYFDMGDSRKGFRGMAVYAGNFAQNIIINMPGTTPFDDCREMQVYASSADFCKITFGNDLEWQDGILECPVNSPYNGPEIAPCVIDASAGNDGIITDTTIYANEGIPKDVYIIGGVFSGTTTIQCNSLGQISYAPFNSASGCWNTRNPTTDPTKNPTVTTNNSTPTPISNSTPPTSGPTTYPTTIYPTTIPSASPTYYPSSHPTITPSTFPTIIPTIYPTYYPTYYPSSYPT